MKNLRSFLPNWLRPKNTSLDLGRLPHQGERECARRRRQMARAAERAHIRQEAYELRYRALIRSFNLEKEAA